MKYVRSHDMDNGWVLVYVVDVYVSMQFKQMADLYSAIC